MTPHPQLEKVLRHAEDKAYLVMKLYMYDKMERSYIIDCISWGLSETKPHDKIRIKDVQTIKVEVPGAAWKFVLTFTKKCRWCHQTVQDQVNLVKPKMTHPCEWCYDKAF